MDELNTFAPQMLAKLQQLPELSDVASDQQVLGLRAKLVFDRDTAARFGITTSAIDQTLYDAYGQRQVSTMFTQLNQYHVVLEVKPGFQKNPSNLSDLFIRTSAGSRPALHRRRRNSVVGTRLDCTIQSVDRSRMAARSRSTPSRTWRRPRFRSP